MHTYYVPHFHACVEGGVDTEYPRSLQEAKGSLCIRAQIAANRHQVSRPPVHGRIGSMSGHSIAARYLAKHIMSLLHGHPSASRYLLTTVSPSPPPAVGICGRHHHGS